MAPTSEEKHRKVFISVLGAGPYTKCKYVKKDEGFTSSETLFVQQATLEYLQVAQQWNAEDVGLFLLTKKARTDNWDKSITSRVDNRTKENRAYTGLEAVLGGMNLPIQIKDLDIVDGNNEEEIWSIFNTVFDFLQAGDHLYFDVTHAFRSIPMLILVLCNYAKFLNKTEIKSITYGNYEGRDRNLNLAPIIDLLPLANLQDWTYAAGAYLDTGNVDKLVELANMHVNPILKATKGHDHDAKALRDFTKALDDVIKERQTCRGISIIQSNTFKKLRQLSDSITNDAIIKPFAPILDEIRKSFDTFDIDANIQNGYAAAKWCFDHKLYQQAVTLLEEAIMTLFCQRHQLDVINDRGTISGFFDFRALSLSSKHADEPSHSNIQGHQKFQELMEDEDLRNPDYINGYTNISDTRNDYNHSGMRSAPRQPDKLIKNIKRCLDIFAPLFAATAGKASPDCFPDRHDHQVLLNLSNHPASGWDAAQLNAARDFGGVKDLPFPAVPPEASEGEIARLADEYCARVLATPGVSAVHLMGEMTFCFALAARLKAAGVKCVASTTRRDVVEQDGAKTSRFSFVRFREY